MREAARLGRGIWLGRQVFLSSLALRYHQEPFPEKADLSLIVHEEQKKYDALRYAKGVHFYTSFGHLNGYSALYYTYMWSRAIAQDILGPFEKNGMRDLATAKRYAEKVLMPGGSKDARELIYDFLGRDWDLGSFRRWLER